MTKRLIVAIEKLLPHIVDDGINNPESDFERATLELVLAYKQATEEQAILEIIIDNLLNREPEPEDDIIAEMADELLSQALQEEPAADWKLELDEILRE